MPCWHRLVVLIIVGSTSTARSVLVLGVPVQFSFILRHDHVVRHCRDTFAGVAQLLVAAVL